MLISIFIVESEKIFQTEKVIICDIIIKCHVFLITHAANVLCNFRTSIFYVLYMLSGRYWLYKMCLSFPHPFINHSPT